MSPALQHARVAWTGVIRRSIGRDHAQRMRVRMGVGGWAWGWAGVKE